MTTLMVDLPADLYERLHAEATRTGRPIEHLVETYIRCHALRRPLLHAHASRVKSITCALVRSGPIVARRYHARFQQHRLLALVSPMNLEVGPITADDALPGRRETLGISGQCDCPVTRPKQDECAQNDKQADYCGGA